MLHEDYLKKQEEYMKKFVVNGNDSSGRQIDKIYFKCDEYVAYEAKDHRGVSAMHIATRGKTPDRDKEIDKRFAKIGPIYQKSVSMLYKSWNPNEAKLRLAQTIYSNLLYEEAGKKDDFEEFITYLDAGHKKVGDNKIVFALTHFILAILTFILVGITFSYYNICFIDKNISWCIVGGVIGGYLMTTIGTSKLLFTPEDAIFRYIFYAFERNVISIFLGITAFLLSKSGLVLSFFTNVEAPNIYMIMLLGIISGYFNAFIPSLLFNAKENLLTKNK